ncbi:major facilitator superfamily domain-containing protein [Lentinula guzmanii]|uniref:Major facilitator superfamily domain-containing protein n=1 Tax=Lentinula guzmanii TaxID=2804957 RepID=A0AA38JSJ9_9AGAR|nr:major facilitator superfamily domain-containing protein [Lentinula guzmanii]
MAVESTPHLISTTVHPSMLASTTKSATLGTQSEEDMTGKASPVKVPDIDVERAACDASDGDRAAVERRIMRRIDLRMLPLLGLLYSLALIDRTNLGVARIAGMGEDLDLSVGARYSVVSCVYFIPYILLELPSNVFLRTFGTRNLLSFCVVAWGAVQLAMAFVPSWKYLALCRVLLGAFEAGFFPALVFIITTWYRRHEVQKRLAAFYLISILTGGFSAILAYGISQLAGRAGLNGWSWIFVIEGALTVVFGCVAWAFLPEFPDNNTFLNSEEKKFVLQRIEEDRGDSLPDAVTIWKVLHHMSDWKIWVYGIMFMCATIPAYAIGFFVTVILSGMGWNLELALLLSAPPYIFAAFSVFVFAWLSDHFRSRAFFLAVQTLLTLVGFIITGFGHQPGWRYFGLFLGNAGSAGCIPGILAYSSNNIVSHSKRAVTTAIIISLGGLGGIIATTIFRQEDFPRYIPGIIATISCQVLLLVLLGVLTLHFWYQNKAKRNTAQGSPGGRIDLLYTL